MEHSEAAALKPHEVIADRVKALRKGRGWSAERLAEAMAAVGIPWTRVVVTKLETGRRPGVSVEELFALAFVLDVAPVHLLVPIDAEAKAPYRVTPEVDPAAAWYVRRWIRGEHPITGVDKRRYFAEIPEDEWRPPIEGLPARRAEIPEELRAVDLRAGADDGER